MKFVLALIVLAAVMAAPGPITWKICSGEKAHGVLDSVEIINNPVVPGQNTTVFGYGMLDKDLTSGTWTLSGYFKGLKVLSKKGNLCQDSTINLPLNSGKIYINGLTCPTSAGKVSVVEKAIFNYKPPTGVYSIKCQMFDQDKEEVLCLNIDVPM